MIKNTFIIISSVTALLNAGVVSASCDSCHGKDGVSTQNAVPTIAGMSATYIQDSFTAFKDGDRPSLKFKVSEGVENDMASIANKMSDADIEKVANKYSSLKFKNFSQSADEAKAAKGKIVFDKKCDICHENGGTETEDDAGILSGQPREYLERQFANISSGDRETPKKMKKKFKKLSDEDKANIIEYLVKGQ